ncbi:MAG: serine/threonine protein kinase [Cyanothece sp. SIO1E1]|nr:serine/threonine protein kinase [Cyanothece sp. SIO1E1]
MALEPEESISQIVFSSDLKETKVALDLEEQKIENTSGREPQVTKVAIDNRFLSTIEAPETEPKETKVTSNTGELLPNIVAEDKSQELNTIPLAQEPKHETLFEESVRLSNGRYQIVQTLSDRVFSQTYIAENASQRNHPKCLIKRLLKPDSDDPEFLQTAQRLFQKEAETLEALGHNYQIPRLLDYFEEDQAFYLVQEFIEGQPLSVELPPGYRWPQNKVIQLLTDILKLLEFIHSQGVIHRDIKPDNIVRRQQNDCLVLVDFGAVKQIQFPDGTQGQSGITIPIGTPGYMPTEQSRGKPRPNSDIYALGIIGIQALTGLNPTQFPEDSETGEILWQQQVQVSKELAAVLSKMVSYHFKDRYQSAAEVLQALNQVTTIRKTYLPSSSPTSSNRFQTNDRVDSWLWSWQKVLLGLGLLIILGGVGLAFLVRQKTDTFEKYKFSLTPPQKWERRELVEDDSDNYNIFLGVTEVLQFVPPNISNSFEANVSVKIEDLSEPTTLDKYHQEVVSKIKKYGTYNLDDTEKTTLAGKSAYRIIYSGNNGEQDLRMMAILALKEEDRVYRIMYKAEANRYDEFLKEAELMVRSFRFL